MRGFGSDNHAGIHPEIFEALNESNVDHAPSYGTDTWSEKAEHEFQKLFNTPCEVFFVFNGTAANVLALQSMVQSYQGVLCSDRCHLMEDECGAPEFFTRAKMISVACTDGKITIADLEEKMTRLGDQHSSQPKALSLTQPTEFGTCYSLEELKSLCGWAKSKGLFIHIDGARIANAVVSQRSTFQDMFTDLGVDVVSFGGTKNGLCYGEAVVFLNPKLAENFKYIRKQGAQLPSKSRFIAAQFSAYLNDNLWRKIAQHSLLMAQKLREKVLPLNDTFPITRPTESNAVFLKIPKGLIKKIRERTFFYVWDEKTFECRLMMSWDTTDEDISNLVEALQQATP